jgi:serine/threonine protein kinase
MASDTDASIRVVAIKVLRPQVSDNPTLRERFEREARAIAALAAGALYCLVSCIT